MVIAVIAMHDARTHAKSHLAASEVTPSLGSPRRYDVSRGLGTAVLGDACSEHNKL